MHRMGFKLASITNKIAEWRLNSHRHACYRMDKDANVKAEYFCANLYMLGVYKGDEEVRRQTRDALERLGFPLPTSNNNKN
jgi:hypothetical protein